MEISAGTQDDFQESPSVEHGYDGLEVNQCPLNWQLENLGRHHQYWKLYTGFKTTKLPSNQCILRGRSRMFQQDNPDPHILQLVEESGCRSAAKSFHKMETFKRKSKKVLSSKIWQRRHRTVEQTRMGNIRLPKVQQMVSSVYRLLVKEDRMLHRGKHGPVSKKLERDAAIKFKVIVNFLSLNIWLVLRGIKYEFMRFASFYLGFIYILHRIQTFLLLGLY